MVNFHDADVKAPGMFPSYMYRQRNTPDSVQRTTIIGRSGQKPEVCSQTGASFARGLKS
jgi:hypothetical protein